MSGPALVAAGAALLAVLALARLAPERASSRQRAPGLLAAALALLARLGRRLGAPAATRDLDGRLAAAGRPFGLRAADVTAAMGGAAALGLALALPLGSLLPGRLGLLAPFALPLAGFLAPDLWLRRRAARRGAAMEDELPDLLDLLRVALGAGLSLDRALAEVARRDRGLLAREWRTAAVEVELGVPRERALAALAARCPCEGIGPLVRALERGARHGTPLVEALAAQAQEARAARARRLTERAARAAPQIQLVVALLLVPSVLLLVAAALLASLLG
ncbi:MAG TPA: type II secretion system F family protein [Conexibacter sp.]|nr:type II secretion system F family protein [Conexibacter sp.]